MTSLRATERAAMVVADFVGGLLAFFGVFWVRYLSGWIPADYDPDARIENVFAPAAWAIDPFPFIFLTLLLSLQASYAAPLILLAQNRQEARERVSLEHDREVAAQARADTDFLAREIAALRMRIGDLATRDFIRSELRDLLEELDRSDDKDGKESRPSR